MPEDYKNKGLTLLKKGQKGIIHAIFSRFGLILPVFGVLLFLYTQSDIGHRVLKAWANKMSMDTKDDIRQDEEVMERLSRGEWRRCGAGPLYGQERLPSGI